MLLGIGIFNGIIAVYYNHVNHVLANSLFRLGCCCDLLELVRFDFEPGSGSCTAMSSSQDQAYVDV